MAWSSGSSELFLTKDNVNRGTKKQGKSSIVSNLLSIVNTGKKQFMYAEDQARITGILLGYFLAKSGFGDNRAITLVGYSLGSVVNFNCLKTMKRLYDKKIQKAALVLNDVQMWAGAYVLDWTRQENEIMENNRACCVVNGHLHNIYSIKDAILGVVFPFLFAG